MELLPILLLAAAASPEHQAEVENWRKGREQRLTADDGWLTVSGLWWLKPGDNLVGAGKDNRIELPAGKAPHKVGAFSFNSGKVRFRPANGAEAKLNGKSFTKADESRDLKSDKESVPDVIQIGSGLSLLVIDRGSQIGIRMKDTTSDIRRNFAGLAWYPVKADWRTSAKFVPHPAPRKMLFDALAGDKQEMESPGYVEFSRNGNLVRMIPVTMNEQLWFIFRDQTAGKTTYPAARFLYTELPKDGKVVLDFNKAYNPPCTFTPFATCPLPPPENRLPFPVEAGEMDYKGKH